jgi:hypothetical protein
MEDNLKGLDEFSGAIICGEFLNCLGKCKFSKKDSAAWS